MSDCSCINNGVGHCPLGFLSCTPRGTILSIYFARGNDDDASLSITLSDASLNALALDPIKQRDRTSDAAHDCAVSVGALNNTVNGRALALARGHPANASNHLSC